MRLALVLALLVALPPLASATWYGPGTFEPDTPYDVQHGSMWPEPHAEPAGERLYFNAFLTTPSSVVNPNVGALESRVQPAGLVHHRAFLGAWKDCNRDGYIGHAESALQDYRSELLPDATVCPEASLHNQGGWVVELVTVGMVDPCEHEPDAVRASECGGMPAFHVNERVSYANGTAVWGDLGAPGKVPAAECVVLPVPRGTTQSTGGVLRYADCQSDFALARAVNGVDGDGSLGLRFDDPENAHRSDSRLNQRLPVGLFGGDGRAGLLEREASEPTFTAWDCADRKGTLDVHDQGGALPRELAVADPTGGALDAGRFPLVIVHALTGVGFRDEDRDPSTPPVLRVPLADGQGTYAAVPALAPSLAQDPTDASAWDALALALDGPAGDCDPSTPGAADAVYPGVVADGDDAILLEARKTASSFVFTFFDGHRGLHPDLDPHTGALTPFDLGLLYTRHERLGAGPLWSASAPSEQEPQLLTRGRLTPAEPRHFTYYAHVGEDALALFATPVPGAFHTYGAEWCGDEFAGERNGWVCDPALWWKDDTGRDVRPRYARGEPIGRVPGDPYHLRDVDCYDGRLSRDAPVHASLVPLSGEAPCA